jgi:hypothetical protein
MSYVAIAVGQPYAMRGTERDEMTHRATYMVLRSDLTARRWNHEYEREATEKNDMNQRNIPQQGESTDSELLAERADKTRAPTL